MKLNILKFFVLIVLSLSFFESDAYCDKKKVYCSVGDFNGCVSCGIEFDPILGCLESRQSATLEFYIFCNTCNDFCSNQIEGVGEDEEFVNQSCGKAEVSDHLNDDEVALFFELDLSESYHLLEELAKEHPEQAMKLFMFDHEHKDDEEPVTNLRYSQYTSSRIPSFEFFQWARKGELDKIHAEMGFDAIEDTTTLLDNGTTLLVESWSSLLPGGNIEIRTRSSVVDIMFPKIELKVGSKVEFVPIEILADTVTIIEPVKNEKYLYRISSLEW